MIDLIQKRFQLGLAVSALVLGGSLCFLAPQPAQAQVRGLPDFTELVEQVGPAVVNIRTVERARPGAGGSGPDEQMLEFFRRFGIPLPPNAPGSRGPIAVKRKSRAAWARASSCPPTDL